MQDLLEILEAMVRRKGEVDNPRDLFLDMGERIAKHVASALGVKNDEVAILVLSSDGKHLRFVTPRQLCDLGTIPLTKRDSIAVAIFNRKASEAMNNVPTVRHVAFFESVKIRDRAAPIQKMISVAVQHEGRSVGVAQISRKGQSPAEAGPDFTAADVKKAEQTFGAVARYLVAGRPDRF
jgi:hypothetical protein